MSTRLWVICSVLLAGCAVGPDYRRPDVELPAQWKHAASDVDWVEAAPRDRVPRGAWWEVFGDQTLNDLQQQATTANHDLEAAAARVMEARAIARVTSSGWLPAIGLNPSYEHFQRSLSGFGGGARSFTNDQFRVPFDLSYEIDLWGRVRRSFESAFAEAQAREAAYHSALLSLTADVAQLYFAMRTLDTEAAALRHTLELREQTLSLIERRAADGIATTLDVARARTESASAQVALHDTQRRRSELENALAVLCGQPASTFRLHPSPLDIAPPTVPSGLTSQLLERRPDIAEAERRMAAANAQIGVSQAAFFPVVRLTSFAGLDSPKLETLIEADSLVWSLGPSVSVPLFAGGRNRANLEAVQARYEEAVAGYRQQILIAIRDVEDALANLSLRAEEAAAQSRLLDAALEASLLSQHRYEEGLVSYLEVADAERSRLDAELGAVRIRNARLASTVLLIKSLGGGWDDAPVTADDTPAELSSR